ncbi:MAG: hypothetical protein BIFFINMI_00495 [Phycisphaerae bacterium]|nr:hypothetical protein [Phycisphaerae bacterium]
MNGTLAAILVLLLCSSIALAADATPPASPTTQPVQAAKASPNTWIAFSPSFHGAPRGGRYIAVGWNKMVYDARGHRAIIMDRWKDDIRDMTIYANAAIAIDVAADRADVLKLTNHKRASGNGPGGYLTATLPENATDPTPMDRHPYGCLVYCDFDNSIYLGPGANRSAKPPHPQDFWRLDLATRKWSLVDPGPEKVVGKGLLERAMCYDSANKVILFYKSIGAGSTCLYDVVKREWRQPKQAVEPAAGMSAALEYDSKRQVIYLFGGPGSKGKEWNSPGAELWRYSVKDNEWKQLADSPVPARAPALAYDSAHDVLLVSVERQNKPNAVLLYHPADDKWTEMVPPADGGPWPTGGWDTLCYDVTNNVFVLKAGVYDAQRWLVMHYQPTK